MNFELNAGAREADFAKLEQTLGYALPEEFKELYRVANGEPDIDGVFAGDEWLSIDRIIDEYAVWKDLYDDGSFQEDDGTDVRLRTRRRRHQSRFLVESQMDSAFRRRRRQ